VVAVLFAFRFQGYSREVFAIDALLLFTLLAGSRLAFRLFRQVLPRSGSISGRRVLIYGAGDGGELLLRELLNNRDWQYSPIGFLDDDAAKVGKVIHGLKVLGGNGALETLCSQHDIDQVVISCSRMPEERVREIQRSCKEAQIMLKRMQIRIEEISDLDV
jgi:UDP-GlcNAc:undecaprenyl-phosphate GlcNAc-1-phosphate transferase